MSEGLIRGDIRQLWQPVSVDDVIVRERQREVKDEHVKKVAASFTALGGQLQLQPIVLDEDLVLIDGAHRLAAAKASGWTHISALILEGVTSEDRALLEAEANRVRLQLTPLELEEAWSTIYEPAFKARAKQNQVANLRRGVEIPVIGTSNNGEPSVPASLPKAAKEATGLSIETINKISDIRSVANSGTAPEELRLAALKGLEKLQSRGTSVDTVHKSLMKLQERQALRSVDPAEAQRLVLEKTMDRALTDTTLLAEKFAGQLGEDLLAAARLDQVARESLRGIRFALTHALAHVLAAECTLEDDPAAALGRLGGEMTRTLSEQSMKQLNLAVDHG